MLQKLYIRNYAIIEELTIAFDEHLNIITGETGAGKSIILGALSLILGERVDTSVLINRAEKSIVEATFYTQHNTAVNALLEQEGLDIEDCTIIRREIAASGKSRAFVNDTPVNLQFLNQITSLLVDLHRQFDNLAIHNEAFMYRVIDAVAQSKPIFDQYLVHYRSWRQKKNALEKLLNTINQLQQEADYKQFLFDELDQFGLAPDKIEDASEQLKQLSNADNIIASLKMVSYTLQESELPVNSELKKLLQQLSTVTSSYPEALSLYERLNSVHIELKDLALEADRMQSGINVDPETLQSLNEINDTGYRLMKKHNAHTTNQLIEIYNQLKADLEMTTNASEEIAALEAEVEALQQKMIVAADALYQKRSYALRSFGNAVNVNLALIGMPSADFKAELKLKDTFDEFGNTQIGFVIDTNKSGKYTPIQKTASGGELSRIMLSIKTITASALELPTMIFDEVDSGISGEAALQVGLMMQQLGRNQQLICITHQPQVAAKANRHFFIYKEEKDQQIKTAVKILSDEEKVKAIAQMIGGKQPSEAAINNAKELIEL